MSYVLSYDFLDWPLVSGQFTSGLSVQLPGSESLLPAQNGYLVEPAADLHQEAKQPTKSSPTFDSAVEDDWNISGFDSAALHSQEDFLCPDFTFDTDDILPSSPEGDSFDFNAVSENQIVVEPAVHIHDEPALLNHIVQDDFSQNHFATGVDLSADGSEDFTDSGHFGDFDANWLFPPVSILPSLEDVESVLSASPSLDVSGSSDKDPLSPAMFEVAQPEAGYGVAVVPTLGDARFDGIEVSASPLNILVANPHAHDTTSPVSLFAVQSPPNNNWCGNGAIEDPVTQMLNRLVNARSVSAAVTGAGPQSSFATRAVHSPLTGEASASECLLKILSTNLASVRAEPYPTSGVKPERRERKREQNKTAALKYRQKKRSEQGVFLTECEQLEKRNGELKSRVDELTREISYLKGLIAEIYSSQAD